MSTAKLGNSGEHLVMAELLSRGHHAAMCDRGNPAFDILSICGGKHSSLRVKTSRSDRANWSAKKDGTIFLELSRRPDNDFVVIVLMPEGPRKAEFYIVPTAVVDRTLKVNHRKWLASPRLDGKPRRDFDARGFNFEGHPTFRGPGRGYAKKWSRYREAWHLLEGVHAMTEKKPKRTVKPKPPPTEWEGKVVRVLVAKKPVKGSMAAKKWSLLREGMTVEAYLALEAEHALDRPWAKRELKHFIERGFVELCVPLPDGARISAPRKKKA